MKRQCHRNGNAIEAFEKSMISNFRIEGKAECILNAVEQNLGLAGGARRRIAAIVLIKGHHCD